MTKIYKLIILLFVSAAVVAGCGSKEDSSLAEKKTRLEELRKRMTEVRDSIKILEKEIAELDTNFVSGDVLVSTISVKPSRFIHQIEVRGTVESRKNVVISAETMGRIEKINVAEGQEVSKGTLLIKLDADILQNNISEVKTQLDLAETVFRKQENLWKQNIGTEIQYLEAKNNVESLERRLRTLQSQLAQAYVRAPFSGVVDNIPVKVGEMAQPGLPLLRIVSPNQMYIKADVSEAHLGKFDQGDKVNVYFPTQDTSLQSTISSVGKVINDQNRTFTVEVSIPRSSFDFRPNQVTILTLTDYQKQDAISIPSKVILTDDQGKYVYTMVTEEGQKVAKSVRIEAGLTYDGKTEVVSGLRGGEQVISKGYRDVNEGVAVELASL